MIDRLSLVLCVCLGVMGGLYLGPSVEGQEAGGYEAAPTVQLDRVLSPALRQSGHHQVLPAVRTDGNYLSFEIDSDIGLYHVYTLPMVEIRVHEIRTLAEARIQSAPGKPPGPARGKPPGRSLVDEDMPSQLQVGGDSVVEILTSPLQTTSQLLEQTGDKVDQTVREIGRVGQPGSASTGPAIARQSQVAEVDPVMAAYRRSVAGQLDLDVYSTNSKVQVFLDMAAAARSQGGRVDASIMLARTRNAPAQVAGGRVDASIRSLLAHNTRRELLDHVSRRLRSIRLEVGLVDAFVEHPALSPRHKVAIAEYLHFMNGVGRRGELIALALGVSTEEEAVGVIRLAQMLALFHERDAPLRALESVGRGMVGRTEGGGMVVSLSYDILYWNEDADELFTRLGAREVASGDAARDLLLEGVSTARATDELARRGFRVRERFLHAG